MDYEEMNPAIDHEPRAETVISTQHQRRQAEIARIDSKMRQLRHIIIILASLLVIIVVAGISATNRSPVKVEQFHPILRLPCLLQIPSERLLAP